jgi:hypothetical protein
MKPTERQAEILKEFLQRVLEYRETNEEVYDHILTALEDVAENIAFRDAVEDILNNDLGGTKGLKAMEKACRLAAIKEVIRQQYNNISAYFKVNKLPYTIMIFCLIYLTIKILNIAPWVAKHPMYLFLICQTLAAALTIIRRVVLGKVFSKAKDSISSSTYSLIASSFYFPIAVQYLLLFAMPRSTSDAFWAWVSVNPFVVTLAAGLTLIYSLAYIKLITKERKRYLTVVR